mgnify:FL=1
MNYSNNLTKRSRTIAALSLLFFIVYCSVGVCTNLLGSTLSDASGSHVMAQGMDHSQHTLNADIVSEHCANGEVGCDWSVNPVADPATDAQPLSSFFFLYAIAFASLLLTLISGFRQGASFRFAFALQQFYQCGFPRLHLQKAVFLN